MRSLVFSSAVSSDGFGGTGPDEMTERLSKDVF
jgi:hypothetical protein